MSHVRFSDTVAEAGVSFFFKQWGEFSYGTRVGKRSAGSMLDGREHKEFPNG